MLPLSARRPKVWAVGVAVVDIDAQNALELPAAADQPVETIAADGADPAFGTRACLRCARRRADDPNALLEEDLVDARLNLLSRSWIRKRAGTARWEKRPGQAAGEPVQVRQPDLVRRPAACRGDLEEDQAASCGGRRCDEQHQDRRDEQAEPVRA